MFKKINETLQNPVFFRYSFFTFLLSILIIHTCISKEFPSIPLFLLSVVCLGIGFSRLPIWLLMLVTTLIVGCRMYLLDGLGENPLILLFFWVSYQIIMLLAVTLMRNLQQTKGNQLELILALSKSLDSRDPYTATHSQNVARYAKRIAEEMKLSPYQCETIGIGGLLHDIGKIGVPEHILTKPGRLTAEEFASIKAHPAIGYETLKHISAFKENGILDMVLYHHERYDGKGYPKGLKGMDIPLVARIIAVADAFDAMTSKRVYREALDWGYVLNALYSNKGTQFDPGITDVFLGILRKEGINLLSNDLTVDKSYYDVVSRVQ